MTIGLSTYAFFWQLARHGRQPLTLADMIDQDRTSGARCSRSATTR